MAANKTPPPLGSYRFVLRKHRTCTHLPTIETVVHSVNGSHKTRDITHGDGVRSQTLFLSNAFFAKRLTRMGWENVTELWESGNFPNGDADQEDELDLAKRAAAAAERHGGVEALDG